MNVGQRIKEMREEKNMTQKQLSEVLYVSSQAVSKWETGKALPDINNLLQLARFFEVKIGDFFD